MQYHLSWFTLFVLVLPWQDFSVDAQFPILRSYNLQDRYASPPGSPRQSADNQVLLKQQQEALDALGCQPKMKVLRVRDLGVLTDNMKNDRTLYPEVIAIKRCISNRSYCGDGQGDPTGFCIPTKTRNKVIQLMSDKGMELINVEEHTQCGCRF